MPFVCYDPDCTGVHSHKRPYRTLCPSARAKHAAAQARYKGTAKGMLTDMRYKARNRGAKDLYTYKGVS